MKAYAPTPSRVLAGKRKIGEAIGRSQEHCWNYVAEIEAILKAIPDAGGRAVAAKLKGAYAVTIGKNTLDRWLELHRDALLGGTLERPMVDDVGNPEDYAEQINSIL